MGLFLKPVILIYSFAARENFTFRNFIIIPLNYNFYQITYFSVSQDFKLLSFSFIRSQSHINPSDHVFENSTLKLAYIDLKTLEENINNDLSNVLSIMDNYDSNFEPIIDMSLSVNRDLLGYVTDARRVKLYNFTSGCEKVICS